ncbi:MAG: hypothetical protein IME93_06195 [Proteobacteria bacterium]|nr:hypothetical protein [Pseudomonadota bacterium]
MKKSIVLLLTILATAQTFAGDGFTHKHLNLDLPTGWTAHLADAKAAPHLGTIKSSNIAGTSITIDCYRGAFHTLTSTRIRGLNTIAAAYPAGQEQIKKKRKIKTNNGKGVWESWKGYVKVGDMTVALSSPMANVKTPDCWLVMIGYTAESNSAQLEKEFLTILKSAR